MRNRLKILLFCLFINLSIIAETGRFEIRVLVNGIQQNDVVSIKDNDLCEMYLYDTEKNIVLNYTARWSLFYTDVLSGNLKEESCDSYVNDKKLEFKLEPSFTGKIFYNSQLSKYGNVVNGWELGCSQNGTVECRFTYDGKKMCIKRDIFFDVLPELPEIKILDANNTGDIDGEKNYDVKMELCDGTVNTAGFIIIYEEDEHDGNPVYLYDFLDEGISLPCIKTLNSICEHSIWCLFNENDYGVRISDWMSLNETDNIKVSHNDVDYSIDTCNGQLKITSRERLKMIEIYSQTGSLISRCCHIYEYERKMRDGIYIIRMLDNKNNVLTKKIIL